MVLLFKVCNRTYKEVVKEVDRVSFCELIKEWMYVKDHLEYFHSLFSFHSFLQKILSILFTSAILYKSRHVSGLQKFKTC